jgi:hypothetical protein
MSTSTLILDPGTNGTAEFTPDSYPTDVTLVFQAQGETEAFYGHSGVYGGMPTTPIKPGQSSVTVGAGSLLISYKVISGTARILWQDIS